MANIKILNGKEDKMVLFKANINDIGDYNKDLRSKIIDKSHLNNKNKNSLRENDTFILSFCEDKDKDLYIPDEVHEGIWNNQTFQYFKDKLIAHKIKEVTYKFYINKLPGKYPKWKKKEYNEFLKGALIQKWEKIYNKLNNELSSVRLEESLSIYNKTKEEMDNLEKKLQEVKHTNIICNNCYKADFTGKRFMCALCSNYNLCQECEKNFYQKSIHPREHTLIQINKNIEESYDISNYSNIISNKEQIFKNVPPCFISEFTVVNSGDNELKGCYIMPVKMGDNYLSCTTKVINESIQRNNPIKIKLVVKIPDEATGYYEGFFRMFTPYGLPFGEVIHIKVLNPNLG